MLINGISSLKLNGLQNNGMKRSNNQIGYIRQNGLMSDTVSFGNSVENNGENKTYTINTFTSTWQKDNEAYTKLWINKIPTDEEIKEFHSKMENHFKGILNLIKEENEKTTIPPVKLSEALLESKFRFQSTSNNIEEKVRLDKDIEDLLKNSKGGLAFSGEFLAKYPEEFNVSLSLREYILNNKENGMKSVFYVHNDLKSLGSRLERDIIDRNEAIKRFNGMPMPNDIDESRGVPQEIWDNPMDEAEDFYKNEMHLDEGQYSPVGEAENLMKENLQAERNTAVVKLYGKDKSLVNDGLKYLLKNKKYSDVENFVKNLENPKFANKAGLKPQVVVFDVVSELKEQGEEGVQAIKNLVSGKNLSESTKNLIKTIAKI